MTDTTTWIPHDRPVDRLRQIPALINELRTLGTTRNPTGETVHTRSVPGPRPPARLDQLDILDHPNRRHDAPPELKAMMQYASRPIWEAVDNDTKAAHPQPFNETKPPTWATECAWLADIWDDARPQLDEADIDMIDGELRRIYGSITAAVGLTPPKQWPCLTPGCGGLMHIDEAGWLVCDLGHQHSGLAKWRRHTAMELDDLAKQFGVPKTTLRVWHTRGKLPYLEGTRRAWPWDVIRNRWPDLAKMVEERERDVR